MGLSDQVATGDQLTKFVQELRPGERVAICSRSGLVMLIQQNFTSDHGLLLAAIHRAVPLISQPDAPYARDDQALRQLAAYLRDLPGRKNVLWFSGGSRIDLLPDASSLPPELNLQAIYDDLEGSRVSVYPIDVRGLTALTNRGMTWQHMRMADLAEATGGKAFYNENGPAQMARRVLNDDGNFYTITYSPHDLHHDNAWHKVKVEASWYRLSYRRGYYDDGRNLTAPVGKDRKVLLAGGQTINLPADRSEPLVFQTSLQAATVAQSNELETPGETDETQPPKKGETSYFVHFNVPSKAFVRRTIDGQRVVVAGTVILTMNSTGRTVGRLFRLVTLTVNEERVVADPDGSLAFDEPINLPPGEDYLRIEVWDAATGKRGTLDLPVQVDKQRKRDYRSPGDGQHG